MRHVRSDEGWPDRTSTVLMLLSWVMVAVAIGLFIWLL